MAGVELQLLAERLAEAGFPVARLEPVTGGCICVTATAVLRDGGRVFAKTLEDSDADLFEADADLFEADADLFEAEAAGLAALRELGGVRVPAVIHVSPRLLVLEALRPCGEGEPFWEQLARMTAALHAGTVSGRFGWHRDGWHGRLRQDNGWESDGHVFFARRRILRWLPEPLVEAEFDRAERRAVERLCAALPELIPAHPPSLTHGDLWPGNILADGSGQPALIDPAVSRTWPEVDLAALWCPPRPPASERFFAVYEELARPFDGWREHAQLLRIWDLFSVIAHGLDDWGAAAIIREVIAPFKGPALPVSVTLVAATEVEITAELILGLLRDQHPDLADRPLTLGARGWDNQLWRLGDDLAVRLPWATETADALLLKEYSWLPALAPRLPLPVPVPQRLGEPSQRFPRPWIVTTWVPGTPADRVPVTRGAAAADILAAFLTALHQPAPAGAPAGRNRGGSLAAAADGFAAALAAAVDLGLIPDPAAVRAVWDDAVAAPAWAGPPLWLHGDLHPANLLTADGSYCGVIDFGDLCAGDPACDLAAAWILLPDGAADRFLQAYRPAVDAATLRRARGCAVMRAVVCLLIGDAGDRGRPGGKSTWGPPARAALRRLTATTPA